MKQYYIIGKGGFAKEVMFLAQIALAQEEYLFMGFIDYKPDINSVLIGKKKYTVHDEDEFLENIIPSKNISLYMGLGDPLKIDGIVQKFKSFSFPNLIHPKVEMHLDSITMGNGNILTAGCLITVDVSIGSFNVLNLNTTLGHDSVVGNCNVINPGANISGLVIIGNFNLIGTNATILQGKKIGSKNKLGAGCVVNKDVGNELIMVGVPAKPLPTK